MSVSVLNRPTLVLNRSWQPVGVATVARALTMLCNASARVVDPEDYQLYTWADWSRLAPRDGEPFLQAVRFRLRVPEVLTLTHYDRVRQSIVTFNRRNLFRRDHATCQYCGKRPGSSELTIDHIVPRSLGGTSTWDNCVLACVSCNAPRRTALPFRRECGSARRPGARTGDRSTPRMAFGLKAGPSS